MNKRKVFHVAADGIEQPVEIDELPANQFRHELTKAAKRGNREVTLIEDGKRTMTFAPNGAVTVVAETEHSKSLAAMPGTGLLESVMRATTVFTKADKQAANATASTAAAEKGNQK